jgi:hypothetical protein
VLPAPPPGAGHGPGPGPQSQPGDAVAGGRLPHQWVSPQVSTLDLVTGAHAILTADGELGARAGRAAAAAGLPVTVTTLERALMRRLGADLIVVRPDQVVAAVWPASAPDRNAQTEFLHTTMAVLGGRQGAETTWTRSR